MKAAELAEFISSKMRVSRIYQPVLGKTLLEHGGNASLREIAQAFLAHDESQVEYYEQIAKQMPVRVLSAHGIVERGRQA